MDWNQILYNITGEFFGGLFLALLIWLLSDWIFKYPDINGKWKFIIETKNTSFIPYENMKLTYVAFLFQEGNTVYGTGEKVLEESNKNLHLEFTGEHRTRIKISGNIKRYYRPFKKKKLILHYEELGEIRVSTTIHILDICNNNNQMDGKFYSSVADQDGLSSWIKKI
jgi:hypothetical protein